MEPDVLPADPGPADPGPADPRQADPRQARRERLNQLLPEVGPTTLARDRVLTVDPALAGLLPEAGLVRGSIVGCQGGTALSVALALTAQASSAGSWLACVGVPTLGVRAAAELGIALERLVMVADPQDDTVWASMMSALIDGFDLIVLRGAPPVRTTTVRRLQARLQARGAVLVVVGRPGPFTCDVTITATSAEWEGLGDGSGRLVRRRLGLLAVGRRSPRPRQAEVWLPGAGGGIEPTATLAGPDLNVIDGSDLNDVEFRRTG